MIPAFTQTPRWAYPTASERATSHPAGPWSAHLDQMTVGIADMAPDLVLVLFRRRQELSTPGTPSGVHGVDVFDPDIEEAADPDRIAWRLQGDRRLVVGRAPPALMTIQLLASATSAIGSCCASHTRSCASKEPATSNTKARHGFI